MVRSRDENTGCHRIPISCEGKEKEYGACAFNHSPLSGVLALNMNGTNSPISALTALNVEVCSTAVNTEQALSLPKGTKEKQTQRTNTNRTYLGVRVRMPVKDMLRDIRIAKGMDPKDIQKKEKKGSKGDKKRANISSDRRNRLKKWQTKSLEELAFIVEVLEEDLKTSTSRESNNHLPTFAPELGNKFWFKNIPQQGHLDESPPTPSCFAATKNSPMESVGIYGSAYSQVDSLFTDAEVKNSSGELDYYIHRRQHAMTCSPSDSKVHVPCPQAIHFSTEMDWWGSPHEIGSPSYSLSLQEQWNSMTYFWNQMEREANLLNDISNQELLTQDEKGRTLLHRAVDEGERSLVYAIARRMADLNKLDSKDAEGRTSLHLAAQKNQHLMVADLISLGANINERDTYGKTCLHHSAENGYIRVLEVLKSYMKNGIYIDLDARDVNGLSALQLASLALKSIVGDLEKSVKVGQASVHSLRKEQVMESLKCLLQMECNLQCLK
ncbi:NF-kappa-B inhibitor zeta isoform X3 [Neoarius graeffei]|uniref:NF-kappa-B inhibitor zeta isoform X3 n=1 Tax=Neoarius graeffei TaxID=443677 RepID=UPI00298D57FE|nr:NF-kappa-B inhibitor zeta isoform X3 [Neoarius graeffei]